MKKAIFFAFFLLIILPPGQGLMKEEHEPMRLPAYIKPKMPIPDQLRAQADFESIVIPLKRAGKLILIDAVIDSIQGNLILDSGSMGLVLNSMYFRTSRRVSGQVSGGITGSVGAITKSSIKKMRLSDVFYENFEADMTDLGHLESARKVKILGFFGLSFLRDFEIVMDLKNNVLELHRRDKSGKRLNPAPRPVCDLSLSMRNTSSVLFIEAKINRKSLVFCLDTGAESNVLSNQLPDKVLNTVTINRRSTLRGVGQQKVDVFHGVMNDFSVEGHQINGMPALVTSLSAMAHSYGMPIDGMLGCDFFEKGVFYFDLKNDELGICFHKNEKE